MTNQEIIIAFLLTMVAGLSTGIGSLIAFLPSGPIRVFFRRHWDSRQES